MSIDADELTGTIKTVARAVLGFCILGITFRDPITYAHPRDVSGQSLGEPLIL